MGNLWDSLSEWVKPVILGTILTAAITGISVGVRRMILWWTQKAREKRYRLILDSRYPKGPFGLAKTAPIIAEMIKQPLSRVETDLRKLEKEGRVYRGGDCWYPATHSSQTPKGENSDW